MPIIQVLVMLNEASYDEDSFLSRLLVYMNVATAQPDKKNQGKIKSMIKKLKPKYLFNYEFKKEEDKDIKEKLNNLDNIKKNLK